jgi:hypothetical protein
MCCNRRSRTIDFDGKERGTPLDTLVLQQAGLWHVNCPNRRDQNSSLPVNVTGQIVYSAGGIAFNHRSPQKPPSVSLTFSNTKLRTFTTTCFYIPENDSLHMASLRGPSFPFPNDAGSKSLDLQDI